MPSQNTIVLIYATPAALSRAFNDFQTCGGEVTFSLLARYESLKGRDDPSLAGSSLQDCAQVTIPHIGPVLAAGPVSDLLLAVLENAAIFGQLSALGACLHSIGIAKERIPEYEAAVRSGACLLFVHGSADQVSRLSEGLAQSRFPSRSRIG